MNSANEIYYDNITRVDLLCGFSHKIDIFPCEKCKKEECEGKLECEGFGSYSLGIFL
jgi:hypothetical protein